MCPELYMALRNNSSIPRAEMFDLRHSESETWIPFVIQQQEEPNGTNIVISWDSDWTGISLINKYLRNSKVVNRVSDQHIYLDSLYDILKECQIESSSVRRAFITGGCDFQPYIKTVQQHMLAFVVFRHRVLFKIFQSAIDDPAIMYDRWVLTIVIICLSYYEKGLRSG